MNTLISTYNTSEVNIIDYYPVLYLVDSINSNIKRKLSGKHVSIIKSNNIHSEIIEQIKKYYQHFDRIVLLDNSHQYEINNISFDCNMQDDWIITGNFRSERWNNGIFIPGYYDINMLAFNCACINDSILDSLKSSRVNNISFPYFSKIRYQNYNRTFEKVCKGINIKLEKCENILL